MVASLICGLIVSAHAACIVEEQISKVRFETLSRAGELAKQLMPLLDEMNVINNKTKDPKRPIGPQLSTEDVGRFSELRQRMLAIQLQQLLESNYGRDYVVIGDLFTLMQKLYLGGKEPTQGDADYKPYGIILLMRYAVNVDADFKGVTEEVTVPPRSECPSSDKLRQMAA
jgi:hypothetical protein